jgi:hypothetical protein
MIYRLLNLESGEIFNASSTYSRKRTWILSGWVQLERSQLVIHRGILIILHNIKLSKYPYSQLIYSSPVEVQPERILIPRKKGSA